MVKTELLNIFLRINFFFLSVFLRFIFLRLRYYESMYEGPRGRLRETNFEVALPKVFEAFWL